MSLCAGVCMCACVRALTVSVILLSLLESLDMYRTRVCGHLFRRIHLCMRKWKTHGFHHNRAPSYGTCLTTGAGVVGGVLMTHRLLTLVAPSVVSCWSEYSSAREKQCDILSCVLEKVVVYVIRFSVIKCMEHCRCWLQSVFANYIIRSKTPTLYGMHYTSTVTPALTSLARLLSTLIFNVISVKAKQG